MSHDQVKVDSSDRLRAVLVIVATLATIAVNSLAAAGYINGTTPAEISARYQTPLTPAGYAFSIWSLIYLGMIAFSIYQMRPGNIRRLRGVRQPYIISCVLNCGWIYFWHYDLIAGSLVVILLLLGVLMSIVFTVRGPASVGDMWLVQAPFGIYAGWVTAAALVNFMVLLSYLQVDGGTMFIRFMVPALMLIAVAAALIVRIQLANFFYPLAVAWALTAIAVKQSGQTAIVVTAAIGVVACLITTGSVVTQLKDSTSE